MSKNTDRAVVNILVELSGDCSFMGSEGCAGICPLDSTCVRPSTDQDTLEQAKQWLKNNPPESPWQSIETAPKDGSDIIIGKKQANGILAPLSQQVFYSVEAGRFLSYYPTAYKIEEATHWMPLPLLPE